MGSIVGDNGQEDLRMHENAIKERCTHRGDWQTKG